MNDRSTLTPRVARTLAAVAAVVLAFASVGCTGSVKASGSEPNPAAEQATEQASDQSSSPGAADPASPGAPPPEAEVDGLSLLAAKAGEVVTVSGRNFRTGLHAVIEGHDVEVAVASATQATFAMPAVRGGLVDVAVLDGAKQVKVLALVSDTTDDGVPIMLVAPEAVCKDTSFRDAKGEVKQGLKDCAPEPLADCSADGQTGCRATAAFPAVDKAGALQPNAAAIRASLTVAGVTGTLADCTGNGVSGCVTTATYKSADLTNLAAGNIKDGVTIAGLTGSLADCTGNGDTGCVTTATYKSADLTNLAAGNIKDGVTIAGLTGTLTLPDPWDLRVGATAAGVTGKLKVSCRNYANTAVFDAGPPQAATVDTVGETLTATAHGYVNGNQVRLSYTTAPTPLVNTTTYYVVTATANTFQLATTLGGGAIDITAPGAAVYVYRVAEGTLNAWDTMDDYNGNGAVLTQTPWAAANSCGGVEATGGDDNVWADVTTNKCLGAGDDCRFKDKISGLEWTEIAAATVGWGEALAYCDGLSFDGQTDWRLPTQKEAMDAYVHGIRSAASANWMSLAKMNNWIWTATTVSNNLGSAQVVYFNHGTSTTISKNTGGQVACVR